MNANLCWARTDGKREWRHSVHLSFNCFFIALRSQAKPSRDEARRLDKRRIEIRWRRGKQRPVCGRLVVRNLILLAWRLVWDWNVLVIHNKWNAWNNVIKKSRPLRSHKNARLVVVAQLKSQRSMMRTIRCLIQGEACLWIFTHTSWFARLWPYGCACLEINETATRTLLSSEDSHGMFDMAEALHSFRRLISARSSDNKWTYVGHY